MVTARRVLKWIDGFDDRHHIVEATYTAHGVLVTAADGAVADCALPLSRTLDDDTPDGDSRTAIEHFADLAQRECAVGVLLARRRAFAVGIFAGRTLVKSKVDTSYVQGRTAAGGWSQQRYARRRGKQAGKAADKAAEVVNRLLVPALADLDAVVSAGDRAAVAAILQDPRLTEVADKATSAHIGDVGEPRLKTLQGLADRLYSVRIHLVEPDSAG